VTSSAPLTLDCDTRLLALLVIGSILWLVHLINNAFPARSANPCGCDVVDLLHLPAKRGLTVRAPYSPPSPNPEKYCHTEHWQHQRAKLKGQDKPALLIRAVSWPEGDAERGNRGDENPRNRQTDK
jgi:hypothetical protein